MSIAEDIINGIFCQECGAYIGEHSGHPRTCKDCKNEKRKEKNEQKPDSSRTQESNQ